MARTWPDDWDERKRGTSCRLCGDLGARSFHSGRTSEALLERGAVARGHVTVVFRGRHAASLTELSTNELASFWNDIQDAGRAVERVFKPCHVNYLLLGNIVPHLHVHVVPRYLDDSAPEGALAWEPSEVAEETFTEQFEQLRRAALLAQG